MTPERIARLRQVLDRRQPDLTLITDFVHKQRNLSAVVRVCDAVGILRVHAVLGDEDYTAFRGTAVGSHNWVQVQRHRDIGSAMQPLIDAGYQMVGADRGAGSIDYREVDFTRPTALVLGAERQGLSVEARRMLQLSISIPMVGMVQSHNVSVAAGIILAEAQRQRELAGLYASRRIDADSYGSLFFEWGHPQVADFCRQRGLVYPALNAEGEIDDPVKWYAAVRAGKAPFIS